MDSEEKAFFLYVKMKRKFHSTAVNEKTEFTIAVTMFVTFKKLEVAKLTSKLKQLSSKSSCFDRFDMLNVPSNFQTEAV